MHFQTFSDEEAAELNRNCIPAQFAGSMRVTHEPASPDQLMPLLRLDTTGRPDVADFIRVLHTEGLPPGRMPPFIYSGGKHPGALLRVDISEPVRCAFNVFLTWPDDEIALKLMAASGTLCLFVGNEYQWEQAMGLRVVQEELFQMIRIWEQHSQD